MEKIDPGIELLIYRFLRGELSVRERERLEAWLREGNHRACFDKIRDKENMLQKSFYFDKLDRKRDNTWRLLERKTGLRGRAIVRRWTVAASVMIPLLLGVIYFEASRKAEVIRHEPRQEEIVPGMAVAKLLLPDGGVVDLGKDSVCSLELPEGGRFVNESGTLTYESDCTGMVTGQYSELRIPRGGEYKVVLPDGTTVWLNAESSLRFPAAFTGDVRKVYAKGELYFDVKHEGGRPFVVEVEKDYTVEVLGTEFNLRAYDVSSRATTLVRGSVRVQGQAGEVLLQPGQQVRGSGAGNLDVSDVDVAPYVAWHEGKFYFVHTPLQEIMEELARWYDVEVVFENESVKEESFSIEMKRFDDFNKVLRLIEGTGMVKIEINGHTVTVK